VFFFRHGIDPQPLDTISNSGSTDYPAWRERTQKEHDFRSSFVHRVILDDPLYGLVASQSVELLYGDGTTRTASTDEEGVVEVDALRGVSVKIRFGQGDEPRERLVFLDLPSVDSDVGVWQRLHNLGYGQVADPPAEPDDQNELLRMANNFAMENGLEPGLIIESPVRVALRTAHDHDMRSWPNRFEQEEALPEEVEGENDKESVS